MSFAHRSVRLATALIASLWLPASAIAATYDVADGDLVG